MRNRTAITVEHVPDAAVEPESETSFARELVAASTAATALPVHLLVVATSSGIDDLQQLMMSIHAEIEGVRDDHATVGTRGEPDTPEAARGGSPGPETTAPPARTAAASAPPAAVRLPQLRLTVASNNAHVGVAACVDTAPAGVVVDWVDGGGRGYGHALNVAAAHALTQARSDGRPAPAWLGACNADLIFPPGSMAAMVEALAGAGPEVGCIAPRLLDAEAAGGGVQPSVGRFPTLVSLFAGRLRSRITRKYVTAPEDPTEVEWATGACLLVRTEAWQAVNGFDAGFVLDYEDTDLARRLRLAGWATRYVPAWQVVHVAPNAGRAPRLERQVHTRASLVRYFAKHRPAWEFHVLGLLMALAAITAGWWHPMGRSWRQGARTWLRLTIRR